MLMLPRKNYWGLDLFDNAFKDPFFTDPDMNLAMLTDIKEEEGNYILDINLPGFDKNDIKVELKDGYLTVNANRDESKEEKDEKGNYIRRERYTGKCSRSYYVGSDLKDADIKASYKDGILNLTLPKKETAAIQEEKKYIPIE